MKRWFIVGGLVAVVVMVTACGDERPALPSAPLASQTALTSVPACNLNGTNQLVSQYFNAADARTVRGLLDQMRTAGAGTANARDRGFDIIAIIARNAQAGTGGNASAASNLINKITPCMFRSLDELPANFPEDYTISVTTTAPGGLGVRGGSADPEMDPVLSRGGFSGVGPQLGVSWVATLDSINPAPSRVAFYGRPGSPGSYDWKVLPRNAKFSPPVVVGVCVDVDVETTSMLHEEHVGLLTFAAAYFLDTETCVSPSSRTRSSSWMHQLAQMFLPPPLMASAAGRGGIGGSTGGIGSEFSANDVPTVNVTFSLQPPASVTVGDTFSVKLRATDPVTGATVGGAQLSILAVNNNGVPKTLLGTLTQTTDNTGIATFGDLSFDPNSTGGFRMVVGGGVLGREAITVGQVTSTKVNSKPAH